MSCLSLSQSALVARLAARFGIDPAAALRCAEEGVPPPVPPAQQQQQQQQQQFSGKRSRAGEASSSRPAPAPPLSPQQQLWAAVLEQVGAVFASFLSVRSLCGMARGDRVCSAAAAAEVSRRMRGSELGRTLTVRHAGEFSLSRLAFCVEICPVQGQFVDLIYETNTKNYAAVDGDLWKPDMTQSACRVHFVIDGFVVYERVEGHYKATRFPVVRLPLPHVVDLLRPNCRDALEMRVPIHREEEMKQWWSRGWKMYTQ